MAVPSLARRGLEGLTLLGTLGVLYLGARLVGFVSTAGARALYRRIHALGGPWFASHCRRHGALLIKIGQFTASRPDLFPLDYVDACAPLRDQADARPWPVVQASLNHAYEGRIADHLPRLEETPLAAASFGQVHRAWLADGTPVAVKVQYPDLAPRVAMDLALLRLALHFFGLLLPGWPLKLIHEEIARTSREEQDYLAEGTSADRLRPNLAKHGIKVPRIFWEHTRETVLVMEFAPGATLARTDLGALPLPLRRSLTERIIDGYLDQLLEVGFFHGDPHAGNFILDGEDLWLIDFGMTAEISARERDLYRRFLECLRQDDTDGMVDVLGEIGIVTPGSDRSALKALAHEIYHQLAHLTPHAFKGSKREAELSSRVGEFLRRMQGGIVFPRHTILLTRALSLVEGLCVELIPGEAMLTQIRPRLRKFVSLRKRLAAIGEELTALWRFATGLPTRLDDVLKPQRRDPALTALLPAVLLVAVLQVDPSPWRTVGAALCGLAVAVAILRR